MRGYVPYASFDVPLFFRFLLGRRADAALVEPPPTTGAVARMALALRRTPYVYFAADLVSLAARGAGYPGPVVAFTRALEAFALRGAAAVCTVNEELRERIAALGVDRSRIHVVGNGIDTSVFCADGPTRDVAPDRTGPTFVYAGTMNDLHGAGVFIDGFARALADLDGATLVMVGRGTEVPHIRAQAKTVGQDAVRVLDAMPGPVVAEVLRGSTAALASLRPESGYAMALATKAVAAAATGTPVIFAGVGPTAAVVTEGGLGAAVPWDADAVADAMRTVAARADDGAERRRRADWVSANASLTAVAKRVSDVLLAAARGR